jgi:hypothetical protein
MQKRWVGVLLYALYLLILSSLFVPLSHTSLVQFLKEFLIRLAIVTVFAAVTFRVINIGAVEPYRITETPSQAVTEDDFAPIELQDNSAMPQSQFPLKRRRSPLIFWIMVLSIYCVTQTSWWNHQAWVGRLMETVIRWAILLSCWGCLVLFFLPKPDASQPELLRVVPSESAKIDAPSAPKSAS